MIIEFKKQKDLRLSDTDLVLSILKANAEDISNSLTLIDRVTLTDVINRCVIAVNDVCKL